MSMHMEEAPNAPASPICQLPYAERFAVWASRVWIETMRSEEAHCQRLENMFHHAKLSEALGPFYSFFTLVTHGAQRTLDFRCPCCKWLGEDEQLFLALVAAYQWGMPATAESVLRDWLHASAARRAAYPARMFAYGLAENAMVLKCRVASASIADISEVETWH